MKKSVKKNLLTACLLLMLGLLTWTLIGCGSTGEEESSVDMSEAGGGNTITVLNYGEYIDTSVLRDFEKETGSKSCTKKRQHRKKCILNIHPVRYHTI